MNGPPAIDHESRWPPALAILAVLVMLTALPDHVHVLPVWVFHLVVIAVLGVMLAVGSRRGPRGGSKSSER